MAKKEGTRAAWRGLTDRQDEARDCPKEKQEMRKDRMRNSLVRGLTNRQGEAPAIDTRLGRGAKPLSCAWGKAPSCRQRSTRGARLLVAIHRQQTAPMETRVKTTRKNGRRGKRAAAKSHRGGLGFHPVDFSTENRILREGWTRTCKISSLYPPQSN